MLLAISKRGLGDMVFGGSIRQGGKSTFQADMVERALDRGRRVLVCKRTGDLLYQRHGHLTSITPVRAQPLDLWLDECARFERFDADAANQDDEPPPPRAA